MAYCFRIRFVLGPGLRLNVADAELPLTDGEGTAGATIRSPKGTPIEDAQVLALVGEGYPSAEVAEAQADRWRSALRVAFARLMIGADFGDRSPGGGFTTGGLRLLEEEYGKRVLNDHHGTMIFECEPPPIFVSQSFKAVVRKSPGQLEEAVAFALTNGVEVSAQERLAYDLYSSASFQATADARFVTLMMALETLLDLEPRSDAARAHVDALIELTKQAALDDKDRQSMLGSLRWLVDESISQAGRRLAQTVGDRTYMDGLEDPVKFFNRCYEMRSRLVHGNPPLPSRGQVDVRAANLEQFLSHLLSGPLLNGVED